MPTLLNFHHIQTKIVLCRSHIGPTHLTHCRFLCPERGKKGEGSKGGGGDEEIRWNHCYVVTVLNSNQESHVDQKNNIVTTAAFMCDATMHEIFDGIGKMINDVLKKVK